MKKLLLASLVAVAAALAGCDDRNADAQPAPMNNSTTLTNVPATPTPTPAGAPPATY